MDLPVIGLWKDGDAGVYITPTVRHALAVAASGAAVVAADATDRPRPDGSTPDLDLVASLSAAISVPVVAEGRVNTPEEAAEALALGAHSVVVGTAITAPTALTARFAAALAPGPGGGAGETARG